jgi:hypothetical protein
MPPTLVTAPTRVDETLLPHCLPPSPVEGLGLLLPGEFGLAAGSVLAGGALPPAVGPPVDSRARLSAVLAGGWLEAPLVDVRSRAWGPQVAWSGTQLECCPDASALYCVSTSVVILKVWL